MNGTQRVTNTILGKPIDRQPIYGWIDENLKEPLALAYGTVSAFEDKYAFDLAHIFGRLRAYKRDMIKEIARTHGSVLPEHLLDADFFTSPDNLEDYRDIEESLRFHKTRNRFCYMQTPGFFEQFNNAFGIENHLTYLLLYPDELSELYRRQADWTISFADHCLDMGMDMINLSDDWGAQTNMMFSPNLWRELIYPHLKRVVDHVHARGAFVSLHSDGCIMRVTDGVAELGFDVVHPWQENAGMSYDVYLDKYADQFAIMGGICVQSALGILERERLEAEIRRVFAKLRGRRWLCCTTHFVQSHCTIEDLEFAYDLIYKLARA